jgi:hypothetical protein
MHYMETIRVGQELQEGGRTWAYCLCHGVFVRGSCNVGTFAEVKARVMRLASDGPILFEGFLWSGCADSSPCPATRYRQNRRATKKRAEPTIARAALTCLNLPIRKLKTEASSYTLLRLLFVLPTYSPQGPSFPERALNRIDTIFFSHVSVCRPIRPFTPETLLDLL